jgi:hypothetical protein
MADQYRDSCVDRQSKTRGTEDPIRVSFYDKDGTRVDEITRKEANCIAALNPKQLFYFQDGNSYQRELLIGEVNKLRVDPDQIPPSIPCPTNPQVCGPPRVQFFGGNGMGAIANAVVSPNSSSVIGYDFVSRGFNYLRPPFARVIDDCGNGTGADNIVQMQPYGTSGDNISEPSSGKGGLEVKNIVVTAPGRGYLSAPNGSKGGNGRVVIPAPDPNDPAPRPPVVSFTASKYGINSPEEVTLFWAVQNATNVSISEIGNNLLLISSRRVTIDKTKTYTLTASGPGGTVTSKVTISLIPALPPQPPVPDPTRPPSVTFVSSKYEVNDLEEFELIWRVTNANNVSIDQEIGEVELNDSIKLNIGTTTTYTLTATGAGGITTQNLTIVYKSPVTPIPPEPPIPPIPPEPPIPPIPPEPPKPPTAGTYKVLMCLDEIYVEDGGFGYIPGDTIKVVPDNGSLVEMEINNNGQIVNIKIISKGCGYTDLPEIIIESATGYNAKLYPVLSATRITDEQALFDVPEGVSTINVVDCVGKIAPKDTFDIVPR